MLTQTHVRQHPSRLPTSLIILLPIRLQLNIVLNTLRDNRPMTNRRAAPNLHPGVNRNIAPDIRLLSNLHPLSIPRASHPLTILHLVLVVRRDDRDVGADPRSWTDLHDPRIVDVAVVVDAHFIVDLEVVAIRRGEGGFDLDVGPEGAFLWTGRHELVCRV